METRVLYYMFHSLPNATAMTVNSSTLYIHFINPALSFQVVVERLGGEMAGRPAMKANRGETDNRRWAIRRKLLFFAKLREYCLYRPLLQIPINKTTSTVIEQQLKYENF
ncbi:hypothetical protein GGTG_08533 [Gaeumannomyces tritici R3-111a-1]|uniref:Uncharacterized protein n=1 Tax=Gaeumannomyces tritici (strain R3-111a-1) TaxID=644352 RepID=J3P4U7_GAET3|nr:hypothetical protein GGTG_08533 [Gaeumannomyces tritici R3-111a-1]EJT74695.1 hypothetical protein GGTG_08533 [Gaeumannomyces tritici R3-111a-1]